MADRFPTYRRRGATLISAPSIDFASAGRYEAQGYRGMSSALDKMSEYAFAEAAEVAKRKGMEYGAENAPTLQQLEDAISGEPEPPQLSGPMPGDEFTYFGQAARAEALKQAQVNLEVAGRQTISDLKLRALNGEIRPDQLQSEIAAAIMGISEAASDESPSMGRALRASLSTVGNSAYVEASKFYIGEARKARDAQIGYFTDTIINNIPNIVAAGPRANKDGQVISVTTLIAAERAKVANANSGNRDDLEAALKAFDDKAKAVYLAQAGDWARQAGASDIIAFYSNGEVNPQSVFGQNYLSASPEVQVEMRGAAQKAFQDYQQFLDNEDLQAVRRLSAQQQQTEQELILSGNYQSLETEQLITLQNENTVSPLFKDFILSEDMNTTDPETNNQVYIELGSNIFDGNKNTYQDIIRARINRQLDRESFVTLIQANRRNQENLGQFGKKAETQWYKWLTKQLGADSGMFSGFEPDKDPIVANIIQEYTQGVERGEVPSDLARSLIEANKELLRAENLAIPIRIDGQLKSPANKDEAKVMIQILLTQNKNGQISDNEYLTEKRRLMGWVNRFNEDG